MPRHPAVSYYCFGANKTDSMYSVTYISQPSLVYFRSENRSKRNCTDNRKLMNCQKNNIGRQTWAWSSNLLELDICRPYGMVHRRTGTGKNLHMFCCLQVIWEYCWLSGAEANNNSSDQEITLSFISLCHRPWFYRYVLSLRSEGKVWHPYRTLVQKNDPAKRTVMLLDWRKKRHVNALYIVVTILLFLFAGW